MQPISKYTKYKNILDQINLQDEDGYIETTKNKIIRELKKNGRSFEKVKPIQKNNVWFTTIEKYLNSIEYAFDKGNITSKKVSHALDNIPEPTSKKFVIRFTICFAFLVLIIFFTSCKANAQANPSSLLSQENTQTTSISKQEKNADIENSKGQEQLFIKRENLRIKSREPGSTSGSIWSDSSQPKTLATEYQPTHNGEVITVTIPDDLQYKPTADQANSPASEKYDPLKSLKFEIVGFEPGGDVYLRATKSYVSESGEQKFIMVMAKMPQRSLNKFEVSARELTQVAVNSTNNGSTSDYSSAGWDLTTSRKISGYAPDLNSAIASLDGQKKEIDTQQKALKDQQKALTDEADRLKKDRERLNTEAAQAKQLLDAATFADPAAQDGKTGNGTNKTQSNSNTNQNARNTKKTGN
jgi:hypothetical protein